MKTFTILLEQSTTGYGAFSPDVPGCAVLAETLDEALRLIKEGLQFHIEGLLDDGEPLPEPLPFTEHLRDFEERGIQLESPQFVVAFLSESEILPQDAMV
jgi:predicted RNase H-like HicB family nuclease